MDEMVEDLEQQEVVEEVENEEQTENESQEDLDVESEDQDTEDDEVVVTINGETPPEETEDYNKAPAWVKDLRKKNRELEKELRNLRKAEPSNESNPLQLGKKPTIEECDYDTELFEDKLSTWFENKRAFDLQEQQKQVEADKKAKEWQAVKSDYDTKKAQLKVSDYELAEDVVVDTLDVVQQNIIMSGAKDSALLVYALGKNPKKAKEMSEIKDPVKFAFAIARLENELKVTTRKAPPPEKTVSSGGTPKSSNSDKTLERLRDEAIKSGDMSKLVAYKNQLKQKG